MLNPDELIKAFFSGTAQSLTRIISRVEATEYKDPATVIRLHEHLLFLLSYPKSAAVRKAVIQQLKAFPERMEYLEASGADMSLFEDPVISGITSTPVTIMAGYCFAEWLSQKYPLHTAIDWRGYNDDTAMASVLSRLLPWCEEEALVEPHFSFREYIDAAKQKAEDLEWLINRFGALSIPLKEKAALFESLHLFIRFDPPFNASRTGLAESAEIYFHKAPLFSRKDVSIMKELNGPLLRAKKLSPRDASNILDIIRAASVVRYRELHGFIWADTGSFCRFDCGRGVTVILNGVLPANRLPLRAYHSGMIFKNGVPQGYVEGISLFEKMEVGFNLYYTYRDGETAWIFSQLLKVFRQHLGVRTFTIDPYQVGHQNKEGIESGAFWFYRKLGFEPIRGDVAKIVTAEETKIAADSAYRTPAATLKRMAKSHLIFSSSISETVEWKNFYLRDVLLAMHRRLAAGYNRSHGQDIVSEKIARELDLNLSRLTSQEREVFANFSMLLTAIGIARWTNAEKRLTVKVIKAKAHANETEYLKLLQQHKKFREALLGFVD